MVFVFALMTVSVYICLVCGHVTDSFDACSQEEEAEFKAYAAQPNLHERIFAKVAPNIFGHADIKKAVACLLFGGARKVCFMLLLAGQLVHLPHNHDQTHIHLVHMSQHQSQSHALHCTGLPVDAPVV